MKKILAMVMAMSMALVMAACTSSEASSSEASSSSETSSSSASAEESSAAESSEASESSAASDGELPQGTGVSLTVYSNSVSDGRGDWLVERAAQDGFTIQYLDAGAAEVRTRLIAEKNAPIADVVFGLDSINW